MGRAVDIQLTAQQLLDLVARRGERSGNDRYRSRFVPPRSRAGIARQQTFHSQPLVQRVLGRTAVL